MAANDPTGRPDAHTPDPAGTDHAETVPDALGALRVWETPEFTGANRLPGRATMLPYPTAGQARAETGARVLSLDGDWAFKVVDRPEDTPADFSAADLDVSGWDTVAVPGNWTMQGHGRPQYTNVQMPFAPTGHRTYRRPTPPGSTARRSTCPRTGPASGSSCTSAARSRCPRSG